MKLYHYVFLVFIIIFILSKSKMVFQLIYYIIKDSIQNIKESKSGKFNFSDFYGIRLICGRTGGGKNMTSNYIICSLRKKYGDSILIATNFNHKHADFKFTSLSDFTKKYDKPIVFFLDESNTIFNSRKYKEFNFSFLRTLTHNRHERKMIYCLTQDYNMLDISFRRLCMYVINCKTRFHRLTSFKTYTLEDYEQLINEKNVQRKMKIKPISKTVFVQTDEMRELYNTLEMVEDLEKDLKD